MRYAEMTGSTHLPSKPGVNGRYMLSILNEDKLRRVLRYLLDETEFLSPYGIRALSRSHRDHPYVFHHGGQTYTVAYVPGDSNTGMFGGNSNWRGPIWMPVNFLILRALGTYYAYFGDELTIECPTGSGNHLNLFQVLEELQQRLVRLFARDESGRRPIYAQAEKFQTDPHWRDYILFYEYFNGDNGMGIGASHQTGWTGVIARIIQASGFIDKSMLQESATPGDTARYVVP